MRNALSKVGKESEGLNAVWLEVSSQYEGYWLLQDEESYLLILYGTGER
jgi:hypothetical protein